MQDRPAAGSNRMDPHHRGTQPDSCKLGLETAFVLPVVMGDIRGRAPHVKSDDLLCPCHGRSSNSPYNSACRT